MATKRTRARAGSTSTTSDADELPQRRKASPKPPATATPPTFVPDALAAAQWASLEDIRRWEKNPRRITRGNVEEAKASLLRFGFVSACVGWTKACRLVVGHARTLALSELLTATPKLDGEAFDVLRRSLAGPTLRHVPIRFRDFASEAEADAYAVRDNRSIGSDDEAALGDVLRSLAAAGSPTDGLGVSEAELIALGVGDPSKLEPDPNAPPRLDRRTPCARCGYAGEALPPESRA